MEGWFPQNPLYMRSCGLARSSDVHQGTIDLGVETVNQPDLPTTPNLIAPLLTARVFLMGEQVEKGRRTGGCLSPLRRKKSSRDSFHVKQITHFRECLDVP
jgi:hypothetical protein